MIYHSFTQLLVPIDHFTELVTKYTEDETERSECIRQFIEFCSMPALSETEFRYQVMQLKGKTKDDLMTETLVDAMDILQSGKKIDNKMLYGFDGASYLLQRNILNIERMGENDANYIYVNKDMSNVFRDYSDRKFGKRAGYPTGFTEVDEATSGGLQPGDLAFLAGFTSEGKSTLLRSLIDRWVFNQNINVAVAISESTIPVFQRGLVSIRSADPKYGFDGPISAKRLKEGRLSPQEEQKLEIVIADMTKGAHGKIAIFVIPSKMTVTQLFAKFKSINNLFRIDIGAIDYINYTTTDVKRNTDREEGSHRIIECKVQAASFDGRGIPVISPFQVSRSKWEEAVKSGFYTLSCMAETSEAEKAADIVWTILNQDDRHLGQLLKNRDGAKYKGTFPMDFDHVAVRFNPSVKFGGVL